ncbi:argininosuccinate synthase [Olsenella uli]|uniref:argininosuccinate synthase n=1 Tax=Olsenella uli TaxID=133926 RepID=UPI0012AB30A9|nr:argininosuccinate synthase [Olsenella uli]
MSEKGKVVLAYSGGLDTSCLLKYLQDDGYDVVSCIASLGQPSEERSDIEAVNAKAKSLGAVAAYDVDIRDEFAEDFIAKAIFANGMYENKYPLLSALSRPAICRHLVKVAQTEGAVAIAHGCTGKGNDQVRFELECKALDPTLEILGPVRSWELTTRTSEIEYAQAKGIPVDATKENPYSIDENVWGRAIECGVLENPWNEAPKGAWSITVDPEEAPDEARDVVLGFEAGLPVSIDGQRMKLYDLIAALNKIVGSHGFGRIDMIEDRLVGLKSRECYEQPGALAIIMAHKQLESLCLPGDVLHTKLSLEHDWSRQVYNGLWYSPLKDALDAFFASTQKTVTGEVRLHLYKGSCTVTGSRADSSMYDFGLATYDKGDTFDRTAAKGFMDLFGLPNRVWAERRVEREKAAGLLGAAQIQAMGQKEAEAAGKGEASAEGSASAGK